LVSVYRRKAISPAGVADAGIGGIETCDVATLLGDAPDDVKEQAWTETTRRATTAPAPVVAIRFLPERQSSDGFSPSGERDTNNPSRVVTVTVARAWRGGKSSADGSDPQCARPRLAVLLSRPSQTRRGIRAIVACGL